MRSPESVLGVTLFAVVVLIITSAYLREHAMKPSVLEPVQEQQQGEVSIRCTTEPAAPIEDEPVVQIFTEQTGACPTDRQLRYLRMLYRTHLEAVRCS